LWHGCTNKSFCFVKFFIHYVFRFSGWSLTELCRFDFWFH
jgi:hypothetical protein